MKLSVLGSVLAGVLLGAIGLLALAADPPSKKEAEKSRVAKFMRAKLASSQEVLEGLVTEDFTMIQTGAQRMIVMSKAAEWNVYGNETYLQDSAEFADAAKELIRRSKEKNIDGATLSYLRMTMSCVNCHNHVRAIKVAAGENFPAGMNDAAILASVHAQPKH